MAEHFDVLIIGAGLSGIGAAWRLRRERPGTTFAILEARDAIGGTWDLFRYPGVRSDSDMFTLSYPFRPWQGRESMAPGASIRQYIRDTADEGGITPHIRFGATVEQAGWSDGRWSVRLAGGETLTCGFLYACAGYYDYAKGHQPDFPGLGDFAGRFVHPQAWPEDLDYAGSRVVVIGSGATAVTLVPAMAPTAGHVTMLQRSPSYLTVLPERDVVADALRRVLPARAAHKLARVKNILLSQGFYQLARRRPERVKAILRRFALQHLPDPAYVDEHFTPAYQPWDQRLCVAPGGDLFNAVAAGTASVVTDHIDRFVPEGIRLRSGRTLPADVVVCATGLSLLPIGGVTLTVDGTVVDPGGTVAYRGVMLSGVPNFAYCIGYTNASWTLRADLSHRYVLRLLSHLERHGYASATPRETPGNRRPLLDLTSGYVQRALDRFPRQGDRDPWTVRQNYLLDVLTTPRADVRRDMTFTRRGAPVLEEVR
ncbi:NAD(P)/FAD-dependent oxidoreductase [Actinoplanes sp. NPDC049118]|uniref:flavin-containing monooxygenase n=1 Tax=Actinoplanes sp. NPDC049118 TaxID=3155769 RepID=UPI0033F12D70